LPEAGVARIIGREGVGSSRHSNHQANGMTEQELTDAEREQIRRDIERLREEHRDLDAAIEALDRVGTTDRLQLQRFKKRKLAVRDKLAMYEDMLTPDIIA
jgi:hypothetical protein